MEEGGSGPLVWADKGQGVIGIFVVVIRTERISKKTAGCGSGSKFKESMHVTLFLILFFLEASSI